MPKQLGAPLRNVLFDDINLRVVDVETAVAGLRTASGDAIGEATEESLAASRAAVKLLLAADPRGDLTRAVIGKVDFVASALTRPSGSVDQQDTLKAFEKILELLRQAAESVREPAADDEREGDASRLRALSRDLESLSPEVIVSEFLRLHARIGALEEQMHEVASSAGESRGDAAVRRSPADPAVGDREEPAIGSAGPPEPAGVMGLHCATAPQEVQMDEEFLDEVRRIRIGATPPFDPVVFAQASQGKPNHFVAEAREILRVHRVGLDDPPTQPDPPSGVVLVMGKRHGKRVPEPFTAEELDTLEGASAIVNEYYRLLKHDGA